MDLQLLRELIQEQVAVAVALGLQTAHEQLTEHMTLTNDMLEEF